MKRLRRRNKPGPNGFYWVASKRKPACEIFYYMRYDNTLTKLCGPGSGEMWIYADRFYKDHPEAIFIGPIYRPENPFKDKANRSLTGPTQRFH